MSAAEDTVVVTFYLSIGLVGCKREEEIEIPASEIPDDPEERYLFLRGYCDDVFSGEVETWWRIAGEEIEA